MRRFVSAAATALLMPVAVLMLIGVHPAKAHVSYCDLAPENCYFAGDGMRYYIPPGSRLYRAYKSGKVGLPYLVERRRKQQACALHAGNGYCRVDPALPRAERRVAHHRRGPRPRQESAR